jgi:hypothetical protein
LILIGRSVGSNNSSRLEGLSQLGRDRLFCQPVGFLVGRTDRNIRQFQTINASGVAKRQPGALISRRIGLSRRYIFTTAPRFLLFTAGGARPLSG